MRNLILQKMIFGMFTQTVMTVAVQLYLQTYDVHRKFRVWKNIYLYIIDLFETSKLCKTGKKDCSLINNT